MSYDQCRKCTDEIQSQIVGIPTLVGVAHHEKTDLTIQLVKPGNVLRWGGPYDLNYCSIHTYAFAVVQFY